MAWVCTSCFLCDTSGQIETDVCPECGEEVIKWRGVCSDCPFHEECTEHHPERWEEE